MTAPRGFWIAGAGSVLCRGSATAVFHAHTTPAPLSVLAALGDSDVFAVGSGGTIHSWTGTTSR